MGAPSLRPAIPLKLLRVDKSILPSTVALLDSGADCSTFPSAWATKMGIDLEKDCEKITGNTAGGETTNFVYASGAEALICGEKRRLHAIFNNGLNVILLGREDFFSYYKILFDQRAKTFTLQPYD
jgi:hypothetical protein